MLFSKYPTALIGHGGSIVLPRVSQEVDYEAELVVVIGRGGRHIPGSAALRACRRLHRRPRRLGPRLAAQQATASSGWPARRSTPSPRSAPSWSPPTRCPTPTTCGIRLRLNGQTMQDSSTSQLIFGVDELIAYLSQVFTLEPGDLIFTGTPPGVGMARKPPVWLKPGDVVEVEIDRLGTLRNPVVAEESRP